jgi:hypothetical protein
MLTLPSEESDNRICICSNYSIASKLWCPLRVITQANLHHHFAEFGRIRDVYAFDSSDDQLFSSLQKLGIAFVTFEDRESAESAVLEWAQEGHRIGDDHRVMVKRARRIVLPSPNTEPEDEELTQDGDWIARMEAMNWAM